MPRWSAAAENPKSEARNPKQIQIEKLKIQYQFTEANFG